MQAFNHDLIFLFSFPLSLPFLPLLSCVRTQKCPICLNSSRNVSPSVLCTHLNMSCLSTYLLHHRCPCCWLSLCYLKFVNLFDHLTLPKFVFTINIVISLCHCVVCVLVHFKIKTCWLWDLKLCLLNANSLVQIIIVFDVQPSFLLDVSQIIFKLSCCICVFKQIVT